MSRVARIRSAGSGGEAHTSQDEPLFRPEVMAERQTQWLGSILLEPRVSSAVFAVAATLAAVAVISLLFLGSFTRKARITGLLVPQQGLARIFAPHAGVVTKVHVKEGLKVAKGQPLLSLSAEVESEALGATREEIVRRLVDRRNSTTATKDVQERLLAQQKTDLQQRLDAIAAEQRHLAEEIALQRTRLDVNKRALANERAMQAQDLIPMTRLQRSEQEHLDQASRLRALERSQVSLKREHIQLQGTLRELPLRREKELAEIERSVAALNQELAEAEARRQIVITAPQDGTVTSIQVEPGGNAVPTIPLMSVVPSDSVLQAHLFSPSRAIGFVRSGQRVLLRYEAFPYQKFGSYEGVVTSVSRSAINPAELTQQLTGLTNHSGLSEPVYRVTVDLSSQSATAYGEAMALQPGMQVEADVMIETRKLYEWVLDPLYSLTGKMG